MKGVSKEEVLELIEQVKHIPVLVEGKRDRLALEKLGFSDIHELDRPLFEVVERVESGSTIQVLMDYDKKGSEWYRKLVPDFKQRNVFVDNRLRDLLKQTQVSHIEGLDSFLEH